MKTTPANKLPDYNGPRTHRSIITKIHEEAVSEGRDMSFDYIYRTVYLFFGSNGFPYYFSKFMSFIIPGLGFWKMNKHGPIHLGKLALKKKEKQRKYNRLKARRYYKYLKKKYKIRKKVHKSRIKHNRIFDWDTMKIVYLK